MVAPAGVLAKVARSFWPTGRFILKTVGCAGLSNPSLTIGLPTSTVRASEIATAGVVVVVVVAGTVLAVGAGDCGVGLAGSVGLVVVGGMAFGSLLVVVIDRLIKKIGMTMNISAAAAEPNARPQGEFKIPRSGFCCGG
jgi:hypothetical protein